MCDMERSEKGMEFFMSTKEIVKSEVEEYATFDLIRYAQVWEDAEVLLEALEIMKMIIFYQLHQQGKMLFQCL